MAWVVCTGASVEDFVPKKDMGLPLVAGALTVFSEAGEDAGCDCGLRAARGDTGGGAAAAGAGGLTGGVDTMGGIFTPGVAAPLEELLV